MTDRLEKLRNMLADDPADQMLRYMLAMELDKTGDSDQSLDMLTSLMNDDAPHVPAFLMAGQQLARLGRVDEANSTYLRGIEEAQRQGNDHAAAEMSQFRAELGL